MGRPLIEFIYAQCLPWQAGGLGSARADVDAKILSRDSSSGECTAIARYPVGWSRAAPEALAVEEEMYVLDGAIAINGQVYKRDSYACFPAGYVRREAVTAQGCVALTFLEGVAQTTDKAVAPEAAAIEFIDLYAMPWDTSVADPAIAWLVALFQGACD